MNNSGGEMTVIITGCAGFIGSHLVAECLARGYSKVVGIDNLSTGTMANIEPFRNNPKFHFFNYDVQDIGKLTEISDIRVVFHQAAVGSVPRSIQNPVSTFKNNVDGFLAVLEWARLLQKPPRIVYASSSSVYGDSKAMVKKEGFEGDPMSPYALSKVMNEQHARLYSKVYGLNTVGLRYFNVYGPRQNPDGAYAAVIPKWIGQLKKGETPVVYGDGSQTRDFTFVSDIVRANLLASTTENPATIGQSINAGAGRARTLLETYETIKETMQGYNIEVPDSPMAEPPRKGDVQHSSASQERINTLLGWKHEVDIKLGLKETTKHIMES